MTKAAHLCVVKFCRHLRAPGRRMCHRCQKRKYRASNPVRMIWRSIKDRAVRRGIEFDLSFADWVEFVNKHDLSVKDHHSRRGYWTVDRIDPSRGYVKDNIRPLLHEENVIKGNRERHVQFERVAPLDLNMMPPESAGSPVGVPF